MNVKINAINPIDDYDIFTHEKELKSCYEFRMANQFLSREESIWVKGGCNRSRDVVLRFLIY